MSYAIHWFRRDLRVNCNVALEKAWEQSQGRVVGVFCFDPQFLGRSDFSKNRFHFFLETLKELRKEMQALGSDLLFLDKGPETAFEQLFASLKTAPQLISWNRDYENYARARDQKLEKMFESKGIATLNERDHLIIEPWEIEKPSNPLEPYQVFTPFQKKWLEVFQEKGQSRISNSKNKNKFCLTWKALGSFEDCFENYYSKNKSNLKLPAAGAEAAQNTLEAFKEKARAYAAQRDIPSVDGTSHFSIYFKNGSLTTSQVVAELKPSGDNKFLNELIWREFYYYILYHFPHVEKTAFKEKYANIKWQNNEKYFEAWKAGKTGYPIVDAGMRQLNETGWMHNRVRMIVASFLTKDLLIDYRWGEQYFMEKLLDGDLAPNNGGWQWAASTGCDAQPYFRIFNPKLQGERFDPENKYIRRWVPEFEDPKKYPSPIVDHAEQREKALALYK